jgi:hypothetical protein
MAVTFQCKDSLIKFANEAISCFICTFCHTNLSDTHSTVHTHCHTNLSDTHSTVHTHCHTNLSILTALSTPNIISMKKNSMDQKLEPGKVATASGYT